MRLINADALIAEMHNVILEDGEDRRTFYEVIERQPTIEPERKKGKWILHPEIKNVYGGTVVQCSECGEEYVVHYLEDEKYCRNCGAKMEGEKDG